MTAGITQVKQELSTNPNSLDALSEAALYYVTRNDYKSATKYYQKLTRLDFHNYKAWTALGHCYLMMKEYQRCFQAYERVLLALPDSSDPQLWYGIGLLYYKFEKNELSLKAFEKLLAISPDFVHSSEILFKLGNIYKAQGSYEEAANYYAKSLNYELPVARKINTLCRKGVCQLKSNNEREAQESFMRALSYGTTNFKTLEYIAWGCLCVKNYSKAIEYCKSAEASIDENPAEIGDLNYLTGLCYYEMGLLQECEGAWDLAMAKNPSSHIYLCSYGILLAKLGRDEEALDHFGRSAETKPNCVEAWYNQGVYYEKNGKNKEASAAYVKAAELGDALGKESTIYLKKNAIGRTELEYRHPKIDISDHPFSIVLPDNPLQPHHIPDIEILAQPAPLPKPKLSNLLLLPKPEPLIQLPSLPKDIVEVKPELPQPQHPTVMTPPPFVQGMDPNVWYQYMLAYQYHLMNYPRQF